MAAEKDTAAIRPGEELDLDRLRGYLAGKVRGASRAELEQFPGGHSNLTYLLRAAGEEYVLRRPPLGPVPPKAHDMAREFRLLEKISPYYRPAPRPILLCEDPDVVGAPFYLMERRRGVILRHDAPPDFTADLDFPEKASRAFIDALAELHRIDIFAHGIDSIGRPEGFLERQVRGWSGRWEGAKTTEMSEMDRLREWLLLRMPESPRATIVHNDYKLDNMMLAPGDPSQVAAVLDWEMTSVGDPLIDVGITLCYWPEAGDTPARRGPVGAITTQPGWWSRRRLMERYEEMTGIDVSGVAYYEVFALFKLAVVLQQIYYRYHVGQTQDDRFRDFDHRVRALVEAAAELAGAA